MSQFKAPQISLGTGLGASGTNEVIVEDITVAHLAAGTLDTDISTVAVTDTTLASAKAIKAEIDLAEQRAKDYAENQKNSLGWKEQARVATTQALPSTSYAAGVITGSAGIGTIDGIASSKFVASNTEADADRILVKNENFIAGTYSSWAGTLGAGAAGTFYMRTDAQAPGSRYAFEFSSKASSSAFRDEIQLTSLKVEFTGGGPNPDEPLYLRRDGDVHDVRYEIVFTNAPSESVWSQDAAANPANPSILPPSVTGTAANWQKANINRSGSMGQMAIDLSNLLDSAGLAPAADYTHTTANGPDRAELVKQVNADGVEFKYDSTQITAGKLNIESFLGRVKDNAAKLPVDVAANHKHAYINSAGSQQQQATDIGVLIDSISGWGKNAANAAAYEVKIKRDADDPIVIAVDETALNAVGDIVETQAAAAGSTRKDPNGIYYFYSKSVSAYVLKRAADADHGGLDNLDMAVVAIEEGDASGELAYVQSKAVGGNPELGESAAVGQLWLVWSIMAELGIGDKQIQCFKQELILSSGRATDGLFTKTDLSKFEFFKGSQDLNSKGLFSAHLNGQQLRLDGVNSASDDTITTNYDARVRLINTNECKLMIDTDLLTAGDLLSITYLGESG